MKLLPPDLCKIVGSFLNLESRICFNQVLQPEERFSKKLSREFCMSHHMNFLAKKLRNVFHELDTIRGNDRSDLKKRVRLLEKIYATLAVSKDGMWNQMSPKLCLAIVRGHEHLEADMARQTDIRMDQLKKCMVLAQTKVHSILAKHAQSKVPIIDTTLKIEDYYLQVCR